MFRTIKKKDCMFRMERARATTSTTLSEFFKVKDYL